MYKFLGFSVFFLCFSPLVIGQRNVKDSIIGTPWIAVSYGGNWANKDLATKFGFLNHIGVLAGYKTSRNWYWGFDGNFMFGSQVKLNGMFDLLVDSKGNITDVNGDIATVVVGARGFNTNLSIGRIFPILSPNSNSGIFVQGGAGLLAHKYRIETNYQVVPQIELDYKKGYDHLTMGPNVHLFLGYAYMADHGLINFYGGLYAQQGFTTNQRTVFFNLPDTPVPTDTMHDVQVGFKAGWFIPFYKRKPKDFYID
jgi:hypothetical protein